MNESATWRRRFRALNDDGGLEHLGGVELEAHSGCCGVEPHRFRMVTPSRHSGIGGVIVGGNAHITRGYDTVPRWELN